MTELHLEARQAFPLEVWDIKGAPFHGSIHQIGFVPGDKTFHDHPCDLQSFVISGAYRELVLIKETGQTKVVEHRRFESFRIPSDHAHLVLDAEPDTFTCVVWTGENLRRPALWEVRDGFVYRKFFGGSGSDEWELMPMVARGSILR